MSEGVFGTDDAERVGEREVETNDTLLPDEDEIYDEGYAINDRPLGVDRFGTTAEEQLDGESLDQRLSEEEPDLVPPELVGPYNETVGGDVGDAPAGRLVAPDEGAHGDSESDEIAFEEGSGGLSESAEEAAMHIIDE